jgi:hypothetical protein
VGAIDVRVGHDDDAVIAQLRDVEVVLADSAAERGDQRADFGGRQHLVETRALDVEDLALERQDRLGTPVASLLGRTACGIAFDQEQLRQRGIFFLAVRELARQACDVERAFTSRELARLAGRFTCPRCFECFRDDRASLWRVLEQELAELLGDERLDDTLDLRRDELVLGLRREFRVRTT